jgi:hypothetical protein
MGLNLNETHQLLIYAYDINLLGENTKAMKKNADDLMLVSRLAWK